MVNVNADAFYVLWTIVCSAASIIGFVILEMWGIVSQSSDRFRFFITFAFTVLSISALLVGNTVIDQVL